MRKVPLTPEKQGSEEIPQSKNAENAENAENADTKTRKMRKMRMIGFNVTGFRWPPFGAPPDHFGVRYRGVCVSKWAAKLAIRPLQAGGTPAPGGGQAKMA